MPNGWYPVPGLDVVLINRTEQRSPRFEWANDEVHGFGAVALHGGRGFTPQGELGFRPSFDVPAVRRFLEASRRDGLDAAASIISVNFKKRSGRACGFFVYGHTHDGMVTLHDHSLGANLSKAERAEAGAIASVLTCQVTAEGLVELSDEATDFEFSFGQFSSIIVSSTPLHYDPHWPPSSPLDVPAVALAQTASRSDILLAIWQEPS
ncbi:MAG: hypothetical protein ACLFVJ_02695 [Persicimonas sp.]